MGKWFSNTVHCHISQARTSLDPQGACPLLSDGAQHSPQHRGSVVEVLTTALPGQRFYRVTSALISCHWVERIHFS